MPHEQRYSLVQLDSCSYLPPYLGEEQEDNIYGSQPDPKHVPRPSNEEGKNHPNQASTLAKEKLHKRSNATPRPSKTQVLKPGPTHSAGKLAALHKYDLRKTCGLDAIGDDDEWPPLSAP